MTPIQDNTIANPKWLKKYGTSLPENTNYNMKAPNVTEIAAIKATTAINIILVFLFSIKIPPKIKAIIPYLFIFLNKNKWVQTRTHYFILLW